ncbi:unnamed protein product [Staurois parvus]|uniref:NADH dehydrogenase subunit 1 n=1 Tax=Staurois parvus TaxID=386267 RepID=A0ABN9HQ16_9NEOB|nr:unnamed protein product [Staurois parvus]
MENLDFYIIFFLCFFFPLVGTNFFTFWDFFFIYLYHCKIIAFPCCVCTVRDQI